MLTTHVHLSSRRRWPDSGPTHWRRVAPLRWWATPESAAGPKRRRLPDHCSSAASRRRTNLHSPQSPGYRWGPVRSERDKLVTCTRFLQPCPRLCHIGPLRVSVSWQPAALGFTITAKCGFSGWVGPCRRCHERSTRTAAGPFTEPTWRTSGRLSRLARAKTPKLARERLAAKVAEWLEEWWSPEEISRPLADGVPRRSDDVGEPRDDLPVAVR